MNIDFSEPLLVGVRYIQLIFIFVFGVLFLFGIFMFIYSFKNPLKRRLAYVLTVFMPMGLLGVIHGPVIILFYVFNQPAIPDASLGLYMFEPTFESVGAKVYETLTRIAKPLLVTVIIIGLAVLHHASRIPGRKRIGYGIFVGVPVLWILMESGPWIINLLIS